MSERVDRQRENATDNHIWKKNSRRSNCQRTAHPSLSERVEVEHRAIKGLRPLQASLTRRLQFPTEITYERPYAANIDMS